MTELTDAAGVFKNKGWVVRKKVLSSVAVETHDAGQGKGAGVFAKSPLVAETVVLKERAIASARCLPLPHPSQYCSHCGDDISPEAAAACCVVCACTFCTLICKEAADATWHHAGPTGLCNSDLTGLLHKVSNDLKEAYLLSLFNSAADEEMEEDGEEEAGMSSEELKVVQEVFTDCILALKVVSTLVRLKCLQEGLQEWTQSLSSAQKEQGAAIVQNFLQNVGQCVQGVEEDAFAAAYDVVVTNSWPGNVSRHLFFVHSLFNHSCTPNATCTTAPGAVLTVSTTTPVPASSELCIDYTDGNPPASLSPEDRAALFVRWGHPCLCSLCRPS